MRGENPPLRCSSAGRKSRLRWGLRGGVWNLRGVQRVQRTVHCRERARCSIGEWKVRVECAAVEQWCSGCSEWPGQLRGKKFNLQPGLKPYG